MKIDLHIHTLPNKNINEPTFEFNLDSLIKFININKLNCIAITNHNFFNKENFEFIKKEIKRDCLVLPGIELSLEKGHILIIGEDNDTTINILEKLTSYIKKINDSSSFYLTLNQLLQFDSFEKFIVIPHYTKDPSIPDSILEQMKDLITAYEVKSQKNFFKVLKNNDNKTPVLFSDFRAKNYDNKFQFIGKYTYLKCESLTFKDIKKSLSSFKNVSLTTDNEINIFDIYSDKVKAYNGVNVLLGKRSTGKTWLLNSINEQFQNNPSINSKQVLYIEQFEITNKDNFNDEIIVESKNIVKKHMQPLINIFDFIENNVYLNFDSDLTKYITSLKSNAQFREKDIFSQCTIFNYKKISHYEIEELIEIIISLFKIKNTNNEYKKIIERYLSYQNIENLIYELRKEYKKLFIKNYIIDLANNISKDISQQLSSKSSVTPIEDCDFKVIFRELYIKEKFNNLISNFKSEIIKEDTIFNKFKQNIKIFKENNKTHKKQNLGIKKNENCDEIFNKDYFTNFVSALNNSLTKNKSKDELIYLFVNYETRITDIYNYPLSGGQESEYILLNKLKNYKYYDVILIDEIENSFDNPFLNKEINSFLKKISENSVIFISTHNNNIGINLNPDYYIYCETKLENNEKKFLKYYGKSTDTFLKDSNGNTISLNDILITTMEASEDAYEQRKSKYNINY